MEALVKELLSICPLEIPKPRSSCHTTRNADDVNHQFRLSRPRSHLPSAVRLLSRELADFLARAAAPRRLPPSIVSTPKVAAADDRRICSEGAERRLEEMDAAGEDDALSLSPAPTPKPFSVSVMIGDVCDPCDDCSKSAKLSCDVRVDLGLGPWNRRYGNSYLSVLHKISTT